MSAAPGTPFWSAASMAAVAATTRSTSPTLSIPRRSGSSTPRTWASAIGRPEITKLADGTWTVMFTSGYNNVNPGNGQGYLYVVNAGTGRPSTPSAPASAATPRHHRHLRDGALPERPGSDPCLGRQHPLRQHHDQGLWRRPVRQRVALRRQRHLRCLGRRGPVAGDAARARRCGAVADGATRAGQGRGLGRGVRRHRALPRWHRPEQLGSAVDLRDQGQRRLQQRRQPARRRRRHRFRAADADQHHVPGGVASTALPARRSARRRATR